MKYYLYQHIRLDTNLVFYIGKGSKCNKGNIYKRAFTKNSRNIYWNNIVNFISYKERVIQEQFDYSEEIKAQLGLTIKFEEPREIAIESANNLGFNSNKRKQKIETKSKGKIANA